MIFAFRCLFAFYSLKCHQCQESRSSVYFLCKVNLPLPFKCRIFYLGKKLPADWLVKKNKKHFCPNLKIMGVILRNRGKFRNTGRHLVPESRTISGTTKASKSKTGKRDVVFRKNNTARSALFQ